MYFITKSQEYAIGTSSSNSIWGDLTSPQGESKRHEHTLKRENFTLARECSLFRGKFSLDQDDFTLQEMEVSLLRGNFPLPRGKFSLLQWVMQSSACDAITLTDAAATYHDRETIIPECINT